MTVYTQVASNRAKTWIYLLIYLALIMALGAAASWWFGSSSILIIVGVISIVQGLISFWYADSIALAISRAQPIEEQDYPGVFKIMQNLTITAGLPMPRLYMIEDPAMNAFATGRDPKHAAIAMTSGLVQNLNENELSGVLAHELSHVGNEDIRLMSMVMIMGGMISLLSHFFTRSLWFGGGDRRRDGDSGGIFLIVGIVLAILAPLAATLIQLAISRKREFMADANAVLLTRYPEGLISALQKIEHSDAPVVEANGATAHMYFSNPLKGGFLSGLFSTHPPIEARIAALEKGSGLAS